MRELSCTDELQNMLDNAFDLLAEISYLMEDEGGGGKEMKNKILNIISILSILFILWVVLSFIEINCKNLSENPTYCPANFFTLISNT